MDRLELGLNHSIHDSIHGSIAMSKNERDVIQHRLYNRLHFVRQNSFLYKVFPTAKHTRFEHSIGVMNFAYRMFLAMIENGKLASQRGDIAGPEVLRDNLHDPNHKGTGVDISNVFDPDSLRATIQELRLAALLHDVGHGPLSHLFDRFAPTVKEFKAILRTDKALVEESPDLLGAWERLLDDHDDEHREPTTSPGSARIEHEHVSSYFTYRILRSIGQPGQAILNILTILKPELKMYEERLKPIHGIKLNIVSLLNDITASGPIDCDRMDYLLRDSYNVGVPYGAYSEDRVLKTLLPFVERVEEGDQARHEIRLGLKTSGLHAVENFILARYELFVQVYGHKTNEAAAAMLNSVADADLSFFEWAGGDPATYSADDFEALYVRMSDEMFMQRLISVFENKAPEHAVTLQHVLDRNLWKRIFEVEEFVKKKEKTEVKRVFDEGYQKYRKEDDTLRYYSSDRFPLKDIDYGARLVQKSEYSYYAVADIELKTASQVIDSLNRGLRISRIYSSGEDLDAIKATKKKVRSELFPQISTARKTDKESQVPRREEELPETVTTT